MFIVLILRKFLKLLRPKTYNFYVINYGEIVWPWMRCFVYIWAGLLLTCGITYFVEFASSNLYLGTYTFGIFRFWSFYWPVCGGFFSWFYFEKVSGGEDLSGLSVKAWLKTNYNDIFKNL